MSDTGLIIAAAKEGDHDRVAALLNGNPSLANASNMLGSQPVHAAHFGGHRHVVELLFDRGVKLDAFLAAELGMLDHVRATPDAVSAFHPRGSTALHGACYWGQVAVARFLLDNGADPDAVTRDSFLKIRPLGSAVATPDVPNPSDREDTVIELVRLLLDHGADVNGRRGDGLTALHAASHRGHIRVIQLLLDRGADRKIQGRRKLPGYEGPVPHAGQTALDVALAQGQTQAAALLQ